MSVITIAHTERDGTLIEGAEALRAAGHQVEVNIDNDTRRTFAEDKAGYHADRATAAERYQAGRESVPVTLRRIAKIEAEHGLRE